MCRIAIKKTNLYCIIFAASFRYPRNVLKNMLMKFQNINLMTILSTLTNIFTMIKTFALDLDIIAYNDCNIIPKYTISNLSNTSKSTNFARLQVASLINHLTKLLKKNQLYDTQNMSPIG